MRHLAHGPGDGGVGYADFTTRMQFYNAGCEEEQMTILKQHMAWESMGV